MIFHVLQGKNVKKTNNCFLLHGKKHTICRGEEPKFLKISVRKDFMFIESQLIHWCIGNVNHLT